jgi:hypothetical protein
MKLAIFSESAADDAAVRILVDALWGAQTEAATLQRFESRRGCHNVLKNTPVLFRHLHYQTDADALVVVLDSNGSPLHTAQHDEAAPADEDCRLCELRREIAAARRHLRPVPGRAALHTGFGLACPAIEAWYRCGLDSHATEAAWARDLSAGTSAPTYISALKRTVYEADRPSLPHEIECATREAHRLAAGLSLLETSFPGGFGALARDVRSWRTHA